jgi:hypothetical protein
VVTDGRSDRAFEIGLEQRASALWPRLDRRALRRCAGNAECIVRTVSRRTALPADAIRQVLRVQTLSPVSPEELATWFG